MAQPHAPYTKSTSSGADVERGNTSAAIDRGRTQTEGGFSVDRIAKIAIAALLAFWAVVLFPWARIEADTREKVELARTTWLETLQHRCMVRR